MSRTNIETVQRFYEFWTDRDYEAVVELIDPDAVMDVSRNVFNPGVHHGIDGFRSFVEQIDEMWDDFHVTPEELIDGGDTIVVGDRIAWKGRGSGVETALVRYGVVTLRDGKVLRFVGGIDDRREALAVAGLSE